MERKQPLEAALAKIQIQRSIMRERERERKTEDEESMEKQQKRDGDKIACS